MTGDPQSLTLASPFLRGPIRGHAAGLGAGGGGRAGTTWLPRSTRGRAPSLCATTAQQPSRRLLRAPKPPDVPSRAVTTRPEPRRPQPRRPEPLTPTRERRPRDLPRRRWELRSSASGALPRAQPRVRPQPGTERCGRAVPGQRRRRGDGMVAAPRPLLGCRRSARSSRGRCRAPAPGRRAGASEIPERGRLGCRRLCAPTRTEQGPDPSRQAAPAGLRSADPRVSAPSRPASESLPFLMLWSWFSQ